MAAQRNRNQSPTLAVDSDRPLIGLVLVEDSVEVTRYFVDEADAQSVRTDTAANARALAGAWSDLDWQEHG